MVEPATGISGALASVRPTSLGQGATADLESAAGELSAAARGLQSVQGQVAGQTMAIQAMTLASQQQSQQLSMAVNQLTMSMSQLVSTMNAMASGMRQPQPMPATHMLMPAAAGLAMGSSAMASGAAMGSMALNAGRMAGQIGMWGLRGAGNMAGAMAAPFIAGSYQAPQPGQLWGQLGNAGAARSLMMGTGLVGMPDRFGQNTSADEIARLGMHRGAFKVGEIGLGAAGGLMNFGAHRLGDAFGHAFGGLGGGVGSMIGSVAGGLIGGEHGAQFGNVAGGFMGGALAGGLRGGLMGAAGGLIAPALMAPVNQILDQMGQMRGTGEMYNRQAFRFNGMGGDRPSFRERTRFGANMLADTNNDLMFSHSDMQDVFGGAVENDLLRGVSGSQQARQRIRQLKDSVKAIGQTLALSIQDSLSLAGELQGHGIGSQAVAGVIMGAANVTGLTKQEALSGQMGFSSKFAGSGLQGAGLMRLAATSQQLGQTAMMHGALSPELLAAVGGRQGAQGVYGDVMTQMAQGGMGQLAMAARMGSGAGFSGVGGAFGAMSQAGGAASAANLINFAANRNQGMRDLIGGPAGQAKMIGFLGDTAAQFKGLGGDQMSVMRLIMQGQGIGADQAQAFVQSLPSMPAALRQQRLGQQRQLAELQVNQSNENLSVTGRLGRTVNGLTMGVSGDMAMGMAGVQDNVVNGLGDVRDAVFGVRRVGTMAGDVTVETAARFRAGAAGTGDRANVTGATVSSELKARVKARVFNGLDRMGSSHEMQGLISDLKSSTDPKQSQALAKKILGKFNYGEPMSPEVQKAYEQALSEQTGHDFSASLSGTIGGVSADDMKQYDQSVSDFRAGFTGPMASMVSSAANFLGKFLGPGGGVLSGLGGMGIDKSVAQRMMRSPNAQALVSAIAAGDSDAMNKARMDLRNDGFESGDVDSLSAQAFQPGGVKSLLGAMSTAQRLAPSEAMAAGFKTASGMASAVAGDAGFNGLAQQFSAGTDGVDAALKAIAGMSKEDRARFVAKGGAMAESLAQTSMIHEGMTSAELQTQAGVDKDIADHVVGAGGKLSAEKVQDLQLAQYARLGATGGEVLTGGRGGFTQVQVQQQLQLSTQIMQTDQLLRSIAAALSKAGIVVDGMTVGKP